MKAYPSNERIWLTGKDDETYNSSNIKWFLWRPKWSVPEESRHKYDKGQLIVNFHNSGAYSYDVQKWHSTRWQSEHMSMIQTTR